MTKDACIANADDETILSLPSCRGMPNLKDKDCIAVNANSKDDVDDLKEEASLLISVARRKRL